MLSASSSLLSDGIHCEVATPENNTAGVHVCVGMEGEEDGGGEEQQGWAEEAGLTPNPSFSLYYYLFILKYTKPVMCVGVLFII